MAIDRYDIYGNHEIAFFNPFDAMRYGSLKIIGNISFSRSAERSKLEGGSRDDGWRAENGLVTNELSITASEYSSFLWTTLEGLAPTVNAAEASGSVSTLKNVKGTSVADAATGIAVVQVESGEEAELKFASIVLKAITATTVNAFAYSDQDFGRGTPLIILDDAGKINESPLTITTGGATTSIPNLGVEIVGGSGTIGMTPGDTAIFDVRPINSGSRIAKTGDDAANVNEFGLVITSDRQSNNVRHELTFYKVVGKGLPINFNRKEFSEWEATLEPFYDEVNKCVGRFRTVKAIG